MPDFRVEDPVNHQNGVLAYGDIGNKMWNGMGSSSSAILFIFSPRILSRQFVRPYVYNFSGNLLDELVSKQFSQGMFTGITPKSDAVLNAILPTSGSGIYEVRNQELSTYYTFMLIVQRSSNAPSLDPFLKAPSPEKRQIISGYFLQEPFTMPVLGVGKPIINTEAVMVFTHDSTFHITPGDMLRSGTQLVNMNHNADNISRTSEQMVIPGYLNGSDNRLYVMRPMDLNRAADMTANFGTSGVSGLGNAALDSVAGSRGGTAAVPVACALKAPMHQLNHICDAARYCAFNNLFESSNTNSYTNPFIPNQDDPVNYRRHANEMFATNLESVDLSPLTREGSDIDTAIPMKLSQLDQMFPGLQVMPFMTEHQASCELTPQDEITSHKSVMSSLLAGTISSMLPGFNIGGIGFSYYSYKTNNFGIDNRGTWVFNYIDPLISNIGPDGIDHNLMACVEMFKRELETNLFPIIKNAGGDFELHADVNSCNVSLLNLIFMDERGMCANPKGYWETNNAFNNFTNPLLAGEGVANSNVAALAAFKDAALASATPPNQPVIF